MVLKLRTNLKLRTTSTRQEHYLLEVKTISKVVVTNCKTGKTNEKETISADRFKSNSNKEKHKNGSVVYFQKNHSPLKQTTAKTNELIRRGKKPESGPF